MSLTPNPAPQFGTAEYAGTSGADRCKICGTLVGAQYYRVRTLMTCRACAERELLMLPTDSHAAYVRGILFGIGGAIIGLILYSTVSIVTGFQIGYMSLAVGYIVAAAMMKGSGGLGGRRYQIAAVALTYAAVSLSFIPIVINHARKTARAKAAVATVQVTSSAEASAPASPAVNDATTASAEAAPNVAPPRETTAVAPRPKRPINWGRAVGNLVLVGLAAPFIELRASPVNGIIGMIILFVGMRIAWRKAEGVPVAIDGPFNATPPAAGAAGAGG